MARYWRGLCPAVDCSGADDDDDDDIRDESTKTISNQYYKYFLFIGCLFAT
jgi:hypothetical protein